MVFFSSIFHGVFSYFSAIFFYFYLFLSVPWSLSEYMSHIKVVLDRLFLFFNSSSKFKHCEWTKTKIDRFFFFLFFLPYTQICIQISSENKIFKIFFFIETILIKLINYLFILFISVADTTRVDSQVDFKQKKQYK